MSRRTPLKFAAALAGLALAVFASGCGESAATASGGEQDPETLIIGHIPSEDSTTMDEEYAGVMKLIEKETGKKVEFQSATSYAAVIEAQRAGKVHLASYGPFSYVVAKDSGVGVEPLAFMAESPEDEGGYHSLALVPKDSTATDLAAFKGKTVCYVDPTSTSGFLYPSAGLLEAGLDPKKDVKPIFAGGHDSSALAIANGQCDVGFAHDGMIDELVESGQLKEGALKEVWSSEVIPSSPVAMLSSLSPELKQQLTDIFQNKLNVDWMMANGYCATAKECGLPDPEAWGYKKVDDSLYAGIRKVCDVTKSDSCQV